MIVKTLLRSIARARRYGTAGMRRVRARLNAWRFESLGTRCGIERGVRFLGDPAMTFSDRVTVRSGVTIGGSGRLMVGARTTINEGVIITCADQVTIGSDCMIAPRAYILDVDHQFSRRDLPIARQGYKTSPVTIGDDVWIGAYAVVLRGVVIGDGAVVGAHSVVSHDVPPFSIVAGVPAKVVGKRAG